MGTDTQGNVYYRSKRTPKGAREKRWVVYDGKVEASRVPPAWHSWLHHTVDEVGLESQNIKNAWQKTHLPNLTGTKFMYSSKQYQEKYQSKHYNSWKPD